MEAGNYQNTFESSQNQRIYSYGKIEGKFYYDARILESDHLESTLQALFDNICNTKHGELLISMIERSQFSQGDLQLLSQAIDKKRASAPLEIECHCPQGQCRCGRR